jgi:hypothetical protein
VTKISQRTSLGDWGSRVQISALRPSKRFTLLVFRLTRNSLLARLRLGSRHRVATLSAALAEVARPRAARRGGGALAAAPAHGRKIGPRKWVLSVPRLCWNWSAIGVGLCPNCARPEKRTRDSRLIRLPVRSCATSGSHPSRNSKTASWPPWISSTRLPLSTLGPTNSTRPPDMIPTSKSMT